MDERLDCEAHFFRNKDWFFAMLLVVSLSTSSETLFKSYDGLRGVRANITRLSSLSS